MTHPCLAAGARRAYPQAMKRDDWTFRYTAKQLAEATKTKIDYHNRCLGFWTAQRDEIIAQIRADGIEVSEKTVLQAERSVLSSPRAHDWSSGGEIMIRNDLRKSLSETYEKLAYHTAFRDQYDGWLRALSDSPDSSHELNMDDWLFFFGRDVSVDD